MSPKFDFNDAIAAKPIFQTCNGDIFELYPFRDCENHHNHGKMCSLQLWLQVLLFVEAYNWAWVDACQSWLRSVSTLKAPYRPLMT